MRALLLTAAVLGAAALVAGCRSSQPARAAASARTFLVIGENTSASQITARHAPYLVGTLKPRAAWVTTYHSFTRSSSLGNYIAMTSGQFTRCEASNDLPDTCHQHVDNVFGQLQRSGRTWFEFNESAANACDVVDHGAAWSKNIYSAHHNPALYYTGLHGTGYDEAITPSAACRRHDLATGTTAPNDTSAMDRALRSGAVGDLNVIVPNDCENGHDPCATKDPVRQFDAFLAREIPKIQASPAFGAGSTILITWDEGADKPLDPGNPLLVAVGRDVRTGVVSTGSYDHDSLLRTLEDRFGVAHLAHARSAAVLPIFR
jgi:phosphatidylinositol-3-phosphatase